MSEERDASVRVLDVNSSLIPFPSHLFMSSRLHPFARLAIATVAVVLAMVLVLVVISAALQTAALSSGRTATSSEEFLARNALFVTVLLYPPALIALWACRRNLDKMSFRSLGLRRSGFGTSFGSGVLAALLTLSLLFGTLWMSGLVQLNGFSSEYSKAGASAWTTLSLTALAFLAVGFTEEVVFRGYAFHNLYAWLGERWAIWIQAIVFGLIHLSNVGAKDGATLADARWGIVNIVLIGVFFALCTLKSGSLWFPIGFHAAWNFALGSLFSLPVSGLPVFRVLDVQVATSWLTGGSFGLEGSALLTPLLIALCWVLSKQPDHEQARTDLAMLRTPAPHEPVVENEIEHDSSPSHLAGIRASMRPQTPQAQLDLRGLNTMRPEPKPEAQPFLIPRPVEIPANTTPANTASANAASASTISAPTSDFTSSTRSDEVATTNVAPASLTESATKLTTDTTWEASKQAQREAPREMPREAPREALSEISLPELKPLEVKPVELEPVEVKPVVAPLETASTSAIPSNFDEPLLSTVAQNEVAPDAVETPTEATVEAPLEAAVEAPKPKPKKPAPKW